MKLLLVLLGVMAPCGVHAEQVYRCGNTYSQSPCGADTAARKLPSSAAPDVPAGPQGELLCATEGLSLLGLADPDDARVVGVARLGTEVIRYADKPTAARKFAVRIKLVGGLAGEQVFHCFLSEDGRRVLSVESTPQGARR